MKTRFKPGDDDKRQMAVFQAKQVAIDTLPAELGIRYELVKSIPVDFEHVGPSAVVARFRAAELSVTGYDEHDAETDLVSWIIDMFDDLMSADLGTLGALPRKQRQVLQRHLRHR